MNNQKNNRNFILDETLRMLSERYEIGLYEYLFKYQYPVYAKIREIEDVITDNFDNIPIEELKNILADYWRLHVESAKKFKSEGQLNFNVNEVKGQINDELHIS